DVAEVAIGDREGGGEVVVKGNVRLVVVAHRARPRWIARDRVRDGEAVVLAVVVLAMTRLPAMIGVGDAVLGLVVPIDGRARAPVGGGAGVRRRLRSDVHVVLPMPLEV